jgi:RHS repeat-associated protein
VRYLPWGKDSNNYIGGQTLTSYRFTGQREEASLGLYYYGARWYNPALGRFIQPDTIVPNPGDVAAFDRYAYVANNPTTWVDPSGHQVAQNVLAFPSASANAALLASSLATLIKLTLMIGRNVASWVFGEHAITSALVLATFSLVLACGTTPDCRQTMIGYGNVIEQFGSTALAGVTSWTHAQLQTVAGTWPHRPAVARPTISRPAGTVNSLQGPWLEACMLSGVLNGLADLATDAFGYQGTANENAGIAAGVTV